MTDRLQVTNHKQEFTMTREVRHNYPPVFAAVSIDSQSPSTNNMVSDALLLAFWIAMVPVFMWVGSIAGF
jgi:hypothetical protein